MVVFCTQLTNFLTKTIIMKINFNKMMFAFVASFALLVSTVTATVVNVQTYGGSWASEVSWDIVNSSGTSVLTGDATTNTFVCLPSDCYTVLMYDSYGDGWNGGYYNVRNCDNVIIANNTNPTGNGATESFIVSDCGSIPGCTNSEATNYNPLANEDDGSCFIPGCTDYNADNYNPDANQDDGTCILYGCTDALAINFDTQANTDNNTCEYLTVPEVFNYELTGANHTIVLQEDMDFSLIGAPISNSDIIGVFYDDENGIEHCAGYAVWQGSTNSIAA